MEDTKSGRSWTFRELADWAESLPPAGQVTVASGRGLDFIGQVLRAWRDGSVLAPVEGDGSAAAAAEFVSATAIATAGLQDLAALPPAIGHVKTTSGSTGAPRRVLMTADQLMADGRSILRTMGLREDWPNVAAISLAHSYGFSNLVLPLLLDGIPLILMESPLPEALRQVLSERRAVTLPAVPALWRAWHTAGVINPRVRLAISAGAPLPVELERAVFDSAGVKIHNFYGSSECGGIAYDRTDTPRADGGVAGTAMEGVILSVNADSGVLEVRGPGVAEGYDVPHPDLEHHVFTTPDLARITAADTVLLLGRTGESIVVAGRKIAPEEVERHLLTLPGVGDCVVFGAPSEDSARVEEIVAGVRLQPGFELSLVRASARVLPARIRPRHWFENGSLGPDARGKISRASWRDQWLAGKKTTLRLIRSPRDGG